MPRKGSRQSAAETDVDVSGNGDDEVVEVEQAPEPVVEAPPEVKPTPRGVGGEYVTRNGILTRS